MSQMPNAEAYETSGAAMTQALVYEQNAKMFRKRRNPKAAANADQLSEHFFEQACKLELAGT